jgi:hypothetical protein
MTENEARILLEKELQKAHFTEGGFHFEAGELFEGTLTSFRGEPIPKDKSIMYFKVYFLPDGYSIDKIVKFDKKELEELFNEYAEEGEEDVKNIDELWSLWAVNTFLGKAYSPEW